MCFIGLIVVIFYVLVEFVIGWLGIIDLDCVVKVFECIVGFGLWFKIMFEMRFVGEWEG